MVRRLKWKGGRLLKQRNIIRSESCLFLFFSLLWWKMLYPGQMNSSTWPCGEKKSISCRRMGICTWLQAIKHHISWIWSPYWKGSQGTFNFIWNLSFRGLFSFYKMTARMLPQLDEDTCLMPILNNLLQGFLAGISSEWSSPAGENQDKLKAEMINDLSKKHFPMCMRTLHDSLMRDNHLKHFGCLQYGLFLKAHENANETE